MLIIMEKRQANEVVVKKRLKASDDGRTLNMEVIRMAPSGEKTKSFTFTKQPVTAAAKR